MTKVFVIDSEGQPCLPTKPRRARQLLDQGKATVKQVVPFTIKLNRKIDKPVGEFEVGVDDGAKHVGIAVSGKTVVGSVRSLKANQIALRIKGDDNYLVSYSKSRLLQRFAGLIYSW